jgi:hypothetical protein
LISTLGVVLLVIGREGEILATLYAGEGSVGVRQSLPTFWEFEHVG